MQPPLVLLPGTLCDERLWVPLAEPLAAAGWPSRAADLGHDDRISAMAARVLDDTPARFVAVGFSMGAIVALEIARIAPHRLAGLALIGVNASADLPERAAVRPHQQAEARAGKLRSIVADQLLPLYFAARNRGDAALDALIMDMALDLGPDVFIRQSDALRTRSDLSTTLSALTCPVLFACGAEDRLCPPAWHAQWKARVPQARFHVLEGAGHMVPLEEPTALYLVLLDWLRNLNGSGDIAETSRTGSPA